MYQKGKINSLDKILTELDLTNFTYNLPPERIAKFPPERRDDSKLLIYKQGMIDEDRFANFNEYINADNLLVFNNSKVIQARLEFYKGSGAKIEIFCLDPINPADIQLAFQCTRKVIWKCLVGNLKKWKHGSLSMRVVVKGNEIVLTATIKEQSEAGISIEFSWNDPDLNFSEVLESAGQTPIPPYLKRNAQPIDQSRYQTVYSSKEGSVAAPTAGLHFSSGVLDRIRKKGAREVELTLHVGIGTFQPIQSDTLSDHEMHSEHFSITLNTLTKLCKEATKVIAVGTTSVRTLESLFLLGAKIHANRMIGSDELMVNQWDGMLDRSKLPPGDALEILRNFMIKNHMDVLHSKTRLMIIPGFKFRVTDVLLTNFHLPRSSLILLVAAFIGEDWRKVYQYAIDNDFRFLSYGDSSFLIPNR